MLYAIRGTLLLSGLLLASLTHATSEAVLWLQGPGDSPRSQALALETDVDIEITGMLAYATVSQRFYNNSGDWAEGRYVFPLPDDSAVESLMVRVGDRMIVGEIQERAEARRTYERARSEGRVASLVEQERGNVFTTSVANIAPDEEIEIRIGFRQRVDFEHGRFSLRFPTTVAPRFAPGTPLPAGLSRDASGNGMSAATSRVTDASRINPPVHNPYGGPHNPLKLRAELRAGMELASLESNFHHVQRDFDGDRWLVTLDGDFDESRRDFELTWRPARPQQVQSAVFRQNLGGMDHALLMMVPPQEFRATQTPREVILIVDTSGSMHGDAIVQARESLLFGLDRLGPLDRFNVIEFNHVTRALFNEPVAASNHHINQARRFVNGLQASGGTVMGPSLAMAMRPPIADGYLRQIVFITDGNIGNETEVLDQIRADIGNSRLFNVGIGHGVNSQFLRDGARYGRGSYTSIGDLTQIQQRMSELVSQLTSPVLHDIELHWPTGVEAMPDRIPDLYTGQPLVVSARAASLDGEVLVTALSDGRPWQQLIPLDAFQQAPGVAAYWGRSAITNALDQRRNGSSPDSVRAEVLDLALEYQLLSQFTSLVAVDRTPSRSREALLRRHNVPTNLPDGRTMEGFLGSPTATRAMPGTDAGTWESLIRGLLALLLIGLLLGHKRFSRDPDQDEQS